MKNIPDPTENPAHDQVRGIETKFQGKESMKLHHTRVQRDRGTAGLVQDQGTFTQLRIITDREQDHLQHKDEFDMFINVTCHTPVTIGKADCHPEPSIGGNLQPDHACNQDQEGVTVTSTLKVFQGMFFTAKMPQDHDRDPVHFTGKMANIETLLQRLSLSWQRGEMRDQDRHGTENVRNIATLLTGIDI